ncbi:FAD-dependent oxidoreductase [Frateuria aurantia]
MPSLPAITIIGAGPAGALLATLLARAGHPVDVFERRPDPELGPGEGGRSINLALAERGLHALRQAGVAEAVLAKAVMMRGRIVHVPGQPSQLLRYGPDDREVLWSIGRHQLSLELSRAARLAGASFHFGHSLEDVDFERSQLQLRTGEGHRMTRPFARLVGADGAGSAVRAAMQARHPLGERFEPLDHAYKELEIPAGRDPAAPFAIEAHGLHIWPRQSYMTIALPNHDGSFTVTLFLPQHGPAPNFDSVAAPSAARALFGEEFPDLLALMPEFDTDFAAHPVGRLGTLYLQQWHLGAQAVLIGDAAHAIVPFHGQGMNCSLEDALELAETLLDPTEEPGTLFARFQQRRKPQTDAIAAMALENYIEMRDSVTDPEFLARRQLAAELARVAPQHFMPRYRMVTFTRLPYAYAMQRGRQQDQWLGELLRRYADPGGADLAAAAAATRLQLAPLQPPS